MNEYYFVLFIHNCASLTNERGQAL